MKGWVRQREGGGTSDLATDHTHVWQEGESESDLTAALAAIAEHIAVALDCCECCIYEFLPSQDAVRARAIWARSLSEGDREWVGRVVPVALMPAFGKVIRQRELLISYPEDEYDAPMVGCESMAYWGELASIYAPICDDDEVLGILELTEKRHRREFTPGEQHLALRMARLAGVAAANARQSDAAETRNRQLAALIDSSRAMTSTLDLDEVLDIICRQAVAALGAQSSYICEYDADDETMVWVAHHDPRQAHDFEEPMGCVYELEDCPQDRFVVRERRPLQIRIDDPAVDPVAREQLKEWGEQAALMVPMMVGDQVLGTLEVSETDYPRHFTEDEVELCRALGEQGALAMRNAQLYRQLRDQKAVIERQATTDGLTGLANHRHFFERLRDEVARAKRYGAPLTVLMLDLDDFKGVNDRFGHPAGDDLLRAVGEVLRGQLRAGTDLPARYGGEEFAVILPHTAAGSEKELADGGRATGERVRKAIAALSLPARDDELRVTASIGLATLPAHAVDADDLVSKADEALYRAKRAGKDRVEVYEARSPRQ